MSLSYPGGILSTRALFLFLLTVQATDCADEPPARAANPPLVKVDMRLADSVRRRAPLADIGGFATRSGTPNCTMCSK
jgi:hypothetical protein